KTSFNVLAETKVDGLSASLRYRGRDLSLGLTRGDGTKGEDITRNLEHIEGIKKTLPNDFPEDIEIRGEIFIKKNIFENLNKNRKRQGLPLFSTARNAAAGSVRQLNPEITKKRNLSFYGYTIIGGKSFFGNSLNNIREILLKYNFSLNKPSKLCYSLDEMIKFYEEVNTSRSLLNYDIDGIVYKLDSISDQEKLGETTRWPRWAIAHKFPAENAMTKIKDVSFQVGRTGTITPVAILEEVLVGGVKINRATLHNQDEIDRLSLSLGDTVSIQRAGDVIPKITSVVKKANNFRKINFPENCPSCNSKLERNKNESAIRCLNHNECKEQVIQSLSHFVSKNAFDISGLGERQLRIFWEKKIIKNFVDIFLLEEKAKLKKVNLEEIEGFGQKSISNLFASIKLSCNISFDRFLYALGIRHVGQGVALIISRKFGSLEKFINYFLKHGSKESFEGVGEIIIKSIKEYLGKEQNLSQINSLLSFINIKYESYEINKFSDKIIVITGSFKNISRNIITQKLIAMGAKVSSNVSKKTDYLFCGEEPGSKLEKAKKFKIKIFNSEEVEKEFEY
ncbi:NAD-dependent DNA ligase LigA, partial [Alphaproteobacteria bacterium]|nr:NAD-dependent DNA ligase LigA [Alphaproteobacteria bacterium]